MSDWSKIDLCPECGAGNPTDAERCLQCNTDIQQARAQLHAIREENMARIMQDKFADESEQIAKAQQDLRAFVSRLLSQRQSGTATENRNENHFDLGDVNSLTEPAIRLQRTEEKLTSKIGGLPCMPNDLAWPAWNGKPLAFLCQLDLSMLPQEYSRHPLPRTGMLYFFYDQVQSTWGFDPKDKGSWQVLYTPANVDECVEREAPDGLDTEYLYSEKFITFSIVDSFPDIQDAHIEAFQLTDEQADEYIRLRAAAFGKQPAHQLFGYPSPAQGNDMDLECQLVSNGIYCGGPSGYTGEKARVLESGRTDWILLLQLDTDEDAGMMWGDCGMLYFWITKDDLAARRFDRSWMVLQCY